MIVVDTTVLSNLARANRINLLEKLHAQIAIPSQVHEEILKGTAIKGPLLLENATWYSSATTAKLGEWRKVKV